ncbi:unnamed protein product, partial [Nesidiocoris tenuis]
MMNRKSTVSMNQNLIASKNQKSIESMDQKPVKLTYGANNTTTSSYRSTSCSSATPATWMSSNARQLLHLQSALPTWTRHYFHYHYSHFDGNDEITRRTLKMGIS